MPELESVREFWRQLHWLAPFWWWLPPLGLLALWAYEALAGGRVLGAGFLPFRRREPVIRHPAAELIARLQAGAASPRARLGPLLRYLGYAILLLLLAAALAQPYRLGERLPEPSPYREVMFVLDTSVSMVLRDYVVKGERVDRMSMLKGVMHRFVDELQGSRRLFRGGLYPGAPDPRLPPAHHPGGSPAAGQPNRPHQPGQRGPAV